MSIDDLTAIVRGIEHRLAALEKQLHQPEQPKAAAIAVPEKPPVYEPTLNEDLAAEIGEQYASSTRDLDW
jgi:hypothetical protein